MVVIRTFKGLEDATSHMNPPFQGPHRLLLIKNGQIGGDYSDITVLYSAPYARRQQQALCSAGAYSDGIFLIYEIIEIYVYLYFDNLVLLSLLYIIQNISDGRTIYVHLRIAFSYVSNFEITQKREKDIYSASCRKKERLKCNT